MCSLNPQEWGDNQQTYEDHTRTGGLIQKTGRDGGKSLGIHEARLRRFVRRLDVVLNVNPGFITERSLHISDLDLSL